MYTAESMQSVAMDWFCYEYANRDQCAVGVDFFELNPCQTTTDCLHQKCLNHAQVLLVFLRMKASVVVNQIEAHSCILSEEQSRFRAIVQYDAGRFDPEVFVNYTLLVKVPEWLGKLIIHFSQVDWNRSDVSATYGCLHQWIMTHTYKQGCINRDGHVRPRCVYVGSCIPFVCTLVHRTFDPKLFVIYTLCCSTDLFLSTFTQESLIPLIPLICGSLNDVIDWEACVCM